MLDRQQLERQYLLLKERARRKAQVSFLDFVLYTTPSYKINWHHITICKALDEVISGSIKKLLICLLYTSDAADE